MAAHAPGHYSYGGVWESKKPPFGSDQWRVSMCSRQRHLPYIKTTAQVVMIKRMRVWWAWAFHMYIKQRLQQTGLQEYEPIWMTRPLETTWNWKCVSYDKISVQLWFQMDRGNCRHYKKLNTATVNICYYSQHDSPVFVSWRFVGGFFVVVVFVFFTYTHCVWYISHPHAQSAFGQIHTYYK